MAVFRDATRPTEVGVEANIPLYFEAFLAQCWKDGNRCGRHLFHDMKQRGYMGSFSNLERLLASWRRAERSVKDRASPVPINSINPAAVLSRYAIRRPVM
jgi:hypothetical protein